ncbi:MAG: InlB B-repeat-containing protein [Clostridia bacterium]|nr:InlB B-repeat-containing protein [Clostridia bacterium]
MKRILGKGKVIVSLVSIFAILAVSMLSMFTGVTFIASAEDEAENETVTYPISGTYDADYVEVTTPGISYVEVDLSKKTVIDTFTGYDYQFIANPDTEGNGTAANPYIIKTANQFAAVVTGNLKDASNNWISTEGLCFKVADNVRAFNLNNTGSSVDFSKDNLGAAAVEAELANATVPTDLKWEQKSGKPFMGRFDGNGVQVYGLKADGGYVAIFPKVGGNITVKNLTVKNCYFTGSTVGAILGANTNPGKSSTYNTKHLMFNCAAYGNVLVCTFNTDEAIQKCGILIAQTEWPTESNLIVNDTLVYGNIAKHATRNITYGIVGNLHRTGSLTVNNSIIMDSAPHALYYGSNAHLTSTYNQMYTNMMATGAWENMDAKKNGDPVKYVYDYLVNGNVPTVQFDHYEKSGDDWVNKTNSGNGYERALSTSIVYVSTPNEIKGATELDGIDAEKWTFNANGYPTPKIYNIREYSAGTNWSGEVAVQFGEGDGSDKAPYTVSTAEEFVLMLMTAEAGKYFKLTADIEINDTSAANWTETAKKWFTSNDVPTFEASLDGNGHTVSGIYYDGTQAGEYAGLIPVVGNTANIKNLTIADSAIKANKGFAGAVAGAVADRCSKVVKFDAVTIEDSVKFEGDAKFGGIIGQVGYSVVKITDCISKTNGLFHSVTGEAKVSRSVSVGAYPFATTERVKAENVYTDTDANISFEGVQVVPSDAMLGAGAASSMPGLNFPTSWKTTDASYPVPTGVAASAEGEVGEVWSGAVATKYAGGTGTQEDPFLIETPEQLALLVTTRYRPGGGMENVKYYKLTADIYVNDVDSPLWEEKIGCQDWFSQWVNGNYITNSHINLDGDGHVVFGLYYDHTQNPTEYVRVGLFGVLCEYSTIQNLGLSGVYFVGSTTEKVADTMGGFVGCVEDFDSYLGLDSHDAEGNKIKLSDPELGYEDKAVKIKNCFIDHRSVISARYSGGIFGSPYSAPIIENTIVTADIKIFNEDTNNYYASTFTGTDSTYGTQLRGCIAFPLNLRLKVVGGSCGSSWRSSTSYWVTYAEPVYYFSTTMSYGGNFTKINNPNDRIGEAAKVAMPLLDWENVWRTVDEGTPIQRVFDKNRTDEALELGVRVKKDAEYFSLKDYIPANTKLSFETGDPDIKIDPIEAPMYSTLQTLPIITRPGYEFLGWFVYDDPAVPYDLGYHPARDLTLYAGWEKKGVTQPFDEYPDSIWDYDSDYWRLNKPGAKGGYKTKYIRNGSKSMHLLGGNTEAADCLLNYEEMLTPGQAYTMTFWVTTDEANHPATLLSLVHNSKPDYLNSAMGIENMAVVTGLKDGEWVQYSYSFTAQTKWVSIRAAGGASLWFDDIVIAEIDGTLDGSKFVALGTGGAVGGSTSPKTGEAVSVAALISVIMACAIVAVVSRKNLVEIVED